MKADLQTHVAFYLTGKSASGGLELAAGLGLRPALFAGYQDLTRLRYDFPLVLVTSQEQAYLQPLSAVMDGVLNQIAAEEDSDRVTRHVLRLEQEIRALAAGGASGALSDLWDAAAARLVSHHDGQLGDSLRRARAALAVDGEIVDCDQAMPARLLRHAWAAEHERKARQFRSETRRLILKLSDILGADFARSEAGRSAEHLKASVGAPYADVFDFAEMSRVLSRGSARASLPERRRERITRVLSVLESQRFFAPGTAGATAGAEFYTFVFDTCAAALRAYRERLPEMTELAKAIAIAELEIGGEYKEGKHDAFFEEFGVNEIDAGDVARFPDYLVCANADRMSADEHARLMEMLSSGLPVKVLVQTDDLLGESPLGDGHLAFGARSRQLTNMAIGLNEVYVLQASASHLCQFREGVLRGLTYRGSALFSVFSGATPVAGPLSPYLNAAAAMESRAFPAFTYDPSAGPNWAARFQLDANPQPERDWPVQGFAYEDEAHQRIATDVAFTPVDFVACDPRYGKHFARVPRAQWNGSLISIDEHLASESQRMPEQVPCMLMVDADNVLQKVIVDDKLIRAALRCREAWHSLQELGGIHNSHAEKLLAREKKAWEQEHQQREVPAGRPEQPPVAGAPVAPPAAVPVAPAAAAPVEAEAAPAQSPDEAYIETPRCTTCNECTQINDKMFAYNDNKQAYIANPDAGTYAQLVEAAESCQVCIIHPGKPRNTSEPGLDELIKRAEPFR